MKKNFLVAYDYGMGGLWGVIRARSAAEINHRFPKLVIVSRRPDWMEAEDFCPEVFDIDNPSGWLLKILQGED